MNSNELKQELIKIGARARLSDLNKERQELFKILGYNDKGRITIKVDKPAAQEVLEAVKDIKEHNEKPTEKKIHWTQTDAGRKKMSKLMKAKYAAGWKTR
jgi:spore cortex formation protein SpoVR/YcgB (stage V sporulation)